MFGWPKQCTNGVLAVEALEFRMWMICKVVIAEAMEVWVLLGEWIGCSRLVVVVTST